MGSARFRRVAIGALVFALLLVVVLAVAGCGQEKEARWQGAAPTTKQMSAADAAVMDQYAQDGIEMSAGNLPAMWIGFWDPAKGYHVGAYGEAVVGGAAASIPDHSRIGSVTKTFTAVAVLEQVEAGKLALADTIRRSFPIWPSSTRIWQPSRWNSFLP